MVSFSLCQSVLPEPIVDPSAVDLYSLWFDASVQATYKVLLIQLPCLHQKRKFWETAHDLDINRVPYYVVPHEESLTNRNSPARCPPAETSSPLPVLNKLSPGVLILNWSLPLINVFPVGIVRAHRDRGF